jgi:CubicO group peptidase (beta-lactamase class C family)
MRPKHVTLLAVFLLLNVFCRAADESSAPLPRSTPEKQGISSAAILDFIQSADRQIDAIHSFMLVRHGKVVAEGWWSPFGPETPHSMFSLSKSFTCTAIGLAVAEGRLSVNDPVLKFFPEAAPTNPSPNLRAMRIRDLLTMSTGQLPDEVAKIHLDLPGEWTREFLALPVEHKPGTFWFYNTPASYMLSAIVQKVTGLTTLDYLQPRLFQPLGIQPPTWDTSSQGISLGGYGLSIRTEDIARFGLLYLDKGNWRGKQLIPASWVAAATTRQSSNGSNPDSDWEQGYGYQFWITRHGLYRGDGAFGQFCIVMPNQDAVVVMTAGTTNTATMMNLVWDKLLPAMQPHRLPADAQNLSRLHAALAGLKMHPPEGSASPGADWSASGKQYLFPPNDQKIEAVALESGRGNAPTTLVIRRDGVEQRITCGFGDWIMGRATWVSDVQLPAKDQPVAASGAWMADGAYEAKLAFYETPFYITLTLRFSGDQLFYVTQYNVVRRGSRDLPPLVGQPH